MAPILILILQILSFTLIARAVLSWFNIGPDSSMYTIWSALHRVTEPILAPIRRVLPPMGGFDLSILLVIIAINVIGMPIAAAL